MSAILVIFRKKNPLKLFMFLFFCYGTVYPESLKIPEASAGILDLRNADFSRDVFNLKGEWEFYWMEFIPPEAFPWKGKPSYIRAPGRWNLSSSRAEKSGDGGKSITPQGYATYHLRVILPDERVGKPVWFRISNMSSAYVMYINGEKISSNGRVSEREDNGVPDYGKLVKSYIPPGNTMEIIFHISNFADPNSGGLWKDVVLGSEENVMNVVKRALAFDLFLLGALIIMSFYHFGLFLLRNEDISSLAFSLFTFVIAFRILFTGELLAVDMFPAMSWGLRGKLEFLSFYLAVPLFTMFMHSLFPREFPRWFFLAVSLVCGFFILDVIFFPFNVFAPRLYWFQIYSLLLMVYTLGAMGIAIYRKREGSIIFSGGLLFFFATVAFDIVVSRIGTYGFITPLGLFVFIFSQSFILSLLFSKAYRSVQFLSNRLTFTNKAFQRFVPEKMLALLNKEDIASVGLGEQIEIEMPVLFSDIRSFTELSESMNPEENFNFLNSYLGRMGPIIRAHNGFIDKYLGDGIMALFPGGNENALKAALAMLKELKSYNRHRNNMQYNPINIGIGLHSGRLMLGTIGEEERMDATVISDAVNTASRIENLTKAFRCNLLISGDFFEKIGDKSGYHYRILGRVKIRGKKKITDIIEIFNEDSEYIKGAKIRNQEKFRVAVDAYHKKDFITSLSLFGEILNDAPEDAAAIYYYERLVSLTGKSTGLEKQTNGNDKEIEIPYSTLAEDLSST